VLRADPIITEGVKVALAVDVHEVDRAVRPPYAPWKS